MRFLGWVLITLTFFGFQNCSPYHASNLSEQTSTSVPSNTAAGLVVDPNLQTKALQVLSVSCGTCHDTAVSGGVTQILDVNHDISTGLIVVGQPTTSRIITAIQTGGMPVGGTLSSTDLTTLQDWISSMHYAGGTTSPPGTSPGTSPGTPPSTTPPPPTGPLPAGKVVIADGTLHAKAMNILNSNCAACHQGMTSGGVDNILDINHLQSTGLIVAGDPTQGSLLAAIANGTMPYGNGARVSAADVATLKSWISSMTIVDQSVAPNPLPTRAALTATYTGVYANIIQPKCTACHGPILAHSVNLSTYNAVKSRTSDILSYCQSGGMPQSPYPMVTNDELTALKTWIQNGAPNN